jgi:hypothetical protein
MRRRAWQFLAVAGLFVALQLNVAATAAAPKSQPDAGPSPQIGTNPCLGTRPGCTMPDGCPGLLTCVQGDWDLPCLRTGSGVRSCSTCQSGHQACGGSGPYGPCTSTTACSNVCGSGTQACSDGTYSACSATGSQPCGGGGCGGTQTCTNGAWGPCTSCPASIPCHTAAGDACGTLGSIACDSATCQPTTSVCTVSEGTTCNNCDDNGDGRIDEGLTCSACNL